MLFTQRHPHQMLPDGITASIRVNKITIPLTTLNLQQIKTGNSIPPYTSCSHLRGLLYTMDCFVAQTVCPTWSAVNCQQQYLTQYVSHKLLSVLTHKHAPNCKLIASSMAHYTNLHIYESSDAWTGGTVWLSHDGATDLSPQRKQRMVTG